MARRTNTYAIRLAVEGGGQVKAELVSVGQSGEQSLKRIESAGDRASGGLKGLGRQAELLRTGIRTLGGALIGAATVGGLAALVDRSISAADAIGKTADKIGVGVEALQEMRFAAKASGIEQHVFDPADGNTHWVYTGVAGPVMAFALRGFFKALSTARRLDPERYINVRVHFVGTDYAPAARAKKSVEPLARVSPFQFARPIDVRRGQARPVGSRRCTRSSRRRLPAGSASRPRRPGAASPRRSRSSARRDGRRAA